MEPTLRRGSVALALMGPRFVPVHRGDIVLFRAPVPSGNLWISRVAAVPGDRFAYRDGIMYVNGQIVPEPYIHKKPDYDMVVRDDGLYVSYDHKNYASLTPDVADVPPRSRWRASNRVPEGFYILLGDNRTGSEDSHVFGFAQDGGTFSAGALKGRRAGSFALVIP